jgi:hypothetical protein
MRVFAECLCSSRTGIRSPCYMCACHAHAFFLLLHQMRIQDTKVVAFLWHCTLWQTCSNNNTSADAPKNVIFVGVASISLIAVDALVLGLHSTVIRRCFDTSSCRHCVACGYPLAAPLTPFFRSPSCSDGFWSLPCPCNMPGYMGWL